MTASRRPLKCDHGLRRQTLVESLLTDVFRGRLRAGQHLVTQDLAERFGVSHTPVREALIALAGIGIIDLKPNRGAVVRPVTASDVREVCAVRRVLECQAVRGACGRIGPDELKALADDLRRFIAVCTKAKAVDVGEARVLDTRLHDLIAAHSGNAFLANELTRLKTLFRAFRDVAYVRHEARNDYRRLADEAREHLAVVEALQAGDRREASRAMARHIRMGVKYWSQALPSAAASTNGSANGRSRRETR